MAQVKINLADLDEDTQTKILDSIEDLQGRLENLKYSQRCLIPTMLQEFTEEILSAYYIH